MLSVYANDFSTLDDLIGSCSYWRRRYGWGATSGLLPPTVGSRLAGSTVLCGIRIYAAYVLAFGGFVLAHPSLNNVVILASWLMVQVLRGGAAPTAGRSVHDVRRTGALSTHSGVLVSGGCYRRSAAAHRFARGVDAHCSSPARIEP